MKISYYDMFDLISEESIDLLTNHMNEQELEKILYQNFDYKITLQNVMKMLPKNRKRKRVTWRGRLLIAALVLMTISSTVFAIKQLSVLEGGIELVSDENKHLIGKELTYNAKAENTSKGMYNILEESDIIKNIEKDAHIPRVVDEFTVTEENGIFLVPEFIFTNDSMVILKKENGSGWDLKKGEALQIQLELYPSEINNGKGQSIIYQYVYDGKLMKELKSEHGLFQNYELNALKSGEYYVCLVGGSSDSITVKKGEIFKLD
ncbi:hypothetical protein [Mediterraneibacter agrestimuris]|uniref:hypothetical protein n=1 Tax=Mediterraneibacter agrestimuris TaxID=2941333 RepID=UPI00203B673C|nr:hypothetical protein [Mediterraneibacter agrestimuris]